MSLTERVSRKPNTILPFPITCFLLKILHSVVQKLLCSCHRSSACYFTKIYISNVWQSHKVETACLFHLYQISVKQETAQNTSFNQCSAIFEGNGKQGRKCAYNVTLSRVLVVFVLPRLSCNSLIQLKQQTAILGDLISSAAVQGTSVFM